MLLEYDWGNPAAAAAAMLLFSEDSAQDNTTQDRTNILFDHYNPGLNMDFFQQQQQQQQQPISASALFSASNSMSQMNSNCHQRFGLGLPPTPARIGLNLGVRTYFSSASPEEGMMNYSSSMVGGGGGGGGGRVCRRRTRMARCQAEGCGADLTHAKHYHRRHKVCEFHSKASIVITAGMSQRFCQQCSRFHVLTEFDQGKRSCRKRLADHNRRRRKSQDLSTTSNFINSQNNTTSNNNTTPPTPFANNTTNNSANLDKPFITIAKLETSSSVTHVSTSPPPTLSCAMHVPPMGLGLGCGAINPPVAELSASSTTAGTSPPQSISFLSQLGEFRGHENRFPIWEDGGIYENK